MRSILPGLVALGLFAAAVGHVVAFGTNCPHSDEWFILHDVTRRGGFSGDWVFAHHNEHRYALAKVAWFAALRATDFDFRTGLFVTLGLVATSVGLLLAAIRRAGPWSVADAFLPVVLLHWGHWFTWLMSFQVAFALVAVCAAGFAWAVTQVDEKRAARLGSAFLAAMAFNGGFGVGWCGPLILWTLYVAWRRRSIGFAVVPVLAAAYLAFVVLTTPPPVSRAARPNLAGAVNAFVLYLATGFGPDGYEATGPRRILASVAAVGLIGLAVVAAARAVVVGRDRVPAAGLLAVLAGHLAVAASIAWYRGEAQGDRFVTPSAVGLAIAWVTVRRYVPLPRAAVVGVVLGSVGVYAVNADPAYWQSVGQREIQGEYMAAVARGTPALFLAGQYGGQWHLNDPGNLAAGFRDANLGLFRQIPPDPPYEPVPVAGPTDLPAWDADDPQQRPVPSRPIPDAPRPVIGLRIRVEQTRSVGWQRVVLVWADDGEHHAFALPPSNGGQQHALVFPTTPRPRKVRLEPASTTTGLKVLAAEWLAAGERGASAP